VIRNCVYVYVEESVFDCLWLVKCFGSLMLKKMDAMSDRSCLYEPAMMKIIGHAA